MNNQAIQGIFPCPIYISKRDSVLYSTEEKEIEDIVKEGMHINAGNSASNNAYIFNSKLKQLKQFCEQQLRIYIEQTINPAEKELDFYITQSWLNVTQPGGWHHEHFHANSIISGVFYISTGENDKITFHDPNDRVKKLIGFEPKEYNIWNSPVWSLSVNTNELIFFPSWLDHMVEPNPKATTDRISLSFNTFAKGVFGGRGKPTELILK